MSRYLAERGALPEDPELTEMITKAMKPWCKEDHKLRLFPPAFHDTVVTLLLVQQRLIRMQRKWEQQQQQAGQPPPLQQPHVEPPNPVAWLASQFAPCIWPRILVFVRRCG